jgi:hypothetical protein
MLKVNDENSRIHCQTHGSEGPDRIHPKMSWIRNTAERLETILYADRDTESFISGLEIIRIRDKYF